MVRNSCFILIFGWLKILMGMKISIYLLKTLALLLGLVFYNYCRAEIGTGRRENQKQELKNAQAKEKIIAFFTACLAGEEPIFQDQFFFKLSETGKEQALVWEAWKEANYRFTEQKLPELEPLKNGVSSRWELPANLEPHAVMPFYWGSKGGAEPEGGYPLYLYIHGSGDKDREWATGLRICQGFDDAPSVYFIPQIPNMEGYYRWWQKSKQFAWEKMLRLAFISGYIDPNRVYFFGISEGGYGSQRLASYYADYLAAAGPMAGGEPLKNAPVENCRNIAFSLRTGAKDLGFYRNKLTGYIKEEFEKWQKLYPESFTHWIELIPERGHSIDYKPTTPWLKQYTRNPYPKFVSWENFEMDGLYRKGFYNLAVRERSHDDGKSRTYYELSIHGNEVDLKVDVVTYKAAEVDPKWGIELKFDKIYQPATKGKVVVYLNEDLVDLNKKVTLTVNGKKVFHGMVKPELKNIVNSCATFFDPERLYPAAIEVDIAAF